MALLGAGSENAESDRTAGREPIENPSVENDRSSGYLGAFDLAKSFGREAVDLKTSWETLAPGEHGALLVCALPADPFSAAAFKALRFKAAGDDDEDDDNNKDDSENTGALTKHDADMIKQWVSRGNTFLLLTSSLPVSRNVFDNGKGIGQKHTFGDELGVSITPAQNNGIKNYVPREPLALFRNVNSVYLMQPGVISHSIEPWIDILGTVFPRPGSTSNSGNAFISNMQPTACMLRCGAGEVIVISDSQFAGNRDLLKADNESLYYNIIESATPKGGKVYFDSYHLGNIQSGEKGVWEAIGHTGQSLVYQLILAGIALLFVLGTRFGLPKSVETGPRRHAGEYVSSLAGFYRAADARGPALSVLFRHFVAELKSSLFAPPDATLKDLAWMAKKAKPEIDLDRFSHFLITCEIAKNNSNLRSDELLELTKQMDSFRKELDIDRHTWS
jgi:hypothetical protein